MVTVLVIRRVTDSRIFISNLIIFNFICIFLDLLEMSWFRDYSLTLPEQFCVWLLKCGAIPKHVAFIMDGNRRFSRQKNIKLSTGHRKGFDKLSEILQWCIDLGIQEITVYAFSIENFKRSTEEVDDLLYLAKQKFQCLLDDKDTLMEKGIRFRVIGDVTLVPADIASLIYAMELFTKDNKNLTLNIAFAYTAREEITQAMRTIVAGYKQSDLDLSDVNIRLLTQCLYTRDSPPPDLCLRTSGEKRLSDFLLLQSAYSYMHFTSILWPEMTVWQLISALFHYQRVQPHLLKAKPSLSTPELSEKATKFLNEIVENHFKKASSFLYSK